MCICILLCTSNQKSGFRNLEFVEAHWGLHRDPETMLATLRPRQQYIFLWNKERALRASLVSKMIQKRAISLNKNRRAEVFASRRVGTTRTDHGYNCCIGAAVDRIAWFLARVATCRPSVGLDSNCTCRLVWRVVGKGPQKGPPRFFFLHLGETDLYRCWHCRGKESERQHLLGPSGRPRLGFKDKK